MIETDNSCVYIYVVAPKFYSLSIGRIRKLDTYPKPIDPYYIYRRLITSLSLYNYI